jgi:ribosome-binding factor A
LADVYVRSLQPLSPRDLRGLLSTLRRSAGRMRRSLGVEVRLKRVPELRFHYDEGPDRRARVDELLEEIRQERSDDD